MKTAEYKFLKINPIKVFFLTLLSAGFYSYIWAYRQWDAAKISASEYKKIIPFFRAVFLDIFMFPQAAFAKREGGGPSTVLVVPVLNICLKVLAVIFCFNIYVLLILSVASAFMMLFFQAYINKILPLGGGAEIKLKVSDAASVFIGFILACFIVFASGPVSKTISMGKDTYISDNSIINDVIGFKVSYPAYVEMELGEDTDFVLFASYKDDDFYLEVGAVYNFKQDLDKMSPRRLDAYQNMLMSPVKDVVYQQVTLDDYQGFPYIEKYAQLEGGWKSKQYIFVKDGITYHIMLNTFNERYFPILDYMISTLEFKGGKFKSVSLQRF
ncbi:hypothetical protein Emin_1332 [Elusimicrobium minutum Pei191]|uniref:Uncharacterized protein n=1 Tax=Elusimicrobium minutum (strain Pei191) TaxID=445932 RepID=B2KED6_ELUMP|nr:hypothetical protein [Elusimicrobium minutum]ACC98882.1 hypothetical protein Emin_1332 [Elusimicrobium minutum Pei191]